MKNKPDEEKLYECSLQMAKVMNLECFSRKEAKCLFYFLLHQSQKEGGKDIWGCLQQGLVTKEEVRRFMMEHIGTNIERKNRPKKADSSLEEYKALFESFEIALYGSPIDLY